MITDNIYNKLVTTVRLVREIDQLEKEREKMRRLADAAFKEMKALKLPHGIYAINETESLVNIPNITTHIAPFIKQ